MNILELHGVGKKRQEGADYQLRIDNFTLDERENVAITGPSGSGKSTTLDMLGMILQPDDTGIFRFNTRDGEKDISQMWKDGRMGSMTELRRQNLGYVLQTGGLFSFLNVRENIELTARTSGINRDEAARRAKDLMEKLEIRHLSRAFPDTLSIGERQRVAIARAIAPRPLVLLADEPTAALDPGLSRKVMRLFLDVVRDYGASVILVSHDLNLVHEFGFREAPIKVLRNGESITAILDDESHAK